MCKEVLIITVNYDSGVKDRAPPFQFRRCCSSAVLLPHVYIFRSVRNFAPNKFRTPAEIKFLAFCRTRPRGGAAPGAPATPASHVNENLMSASGGGLLATTHLSLSGRNLRVTFSPSCSSSPMRTSRCLLEPSSFLFPSSAAAAAALDGLLLLLHAEAALQRDSSGAR